MTLFTILAQTAGPMPHTSGIIALFFLISILTLTSFTIYRLAKSNPKVTPLQWFRVILSLGFMTILGTIVATGLIGIFAASAQLASSPSPGTLIIGLAIGFFSARSSFKKAKEINAAKKLN